MTKLTAEEALAELMANKYPPVAYNNKREAFLRELGYSLIPTDPASVEAMVERGAGALALEWGNAYARAVLTAAIPELKQP